MLLWLYHWCSGVLKLTVCPWKVLTGRSQPSLHTWMHMSVLQEAKVVLFCQSTSKAGAGKYKQQKEYQGTQQRNSYPNNFPPVTYLDQTDWKRALGLLPTTSYRDDRGYLKEGHKVIFFLQLMPLSCMAFVYENPLGNYIRRGKTIYLHPPHSQLHTSLGLSLPFIPL